METNDVIYNVLHLSYSFSCRLARLTKTTPSSNASTPSNESNPSITSSSSRDISSASCLQDQEGSTKEDQEQDDDDIHDLIGDDSDEDHHNVDVNPKGSTLATNATGSSSGIDHSQSPTNSIRSVLSRPRSALQRRATISGTSPSDFRDYINMSEVQTKEPLITLAPNFSYLLFKFATDLEPILQGPVVKHYINYALQRLRPVNHVLNADT